MRLPGSFNLYCTILLFLALLISTSLPVGAQPSIAFQENEFDFGKVDEGIEIKHTFIIRNDGNSPLIISGAKTTCGCTVPKLKATTVASHSNTVLEVMMDTSMKQGHVKKEIKITSNDPARSTASIFILANVKSPHADLNNGTIAKIFQGRCAACHADKGAGEVSEPLYFADCAMCHGFRASGVVAPALLGFDYHNPEVTKLIRDVIATGSKVKPTMPGFSKRVGGPLSDEQIDSLIEYLRWRADQEHKKSQ